MGFTGGASGPPKMYAGKQKMSEIETLVSEIEGGRQQSEALERRIAKLAGLFAPKERRFLSDLDEAVELPGRRGWNFALSTLSSSRHNGQRCFGAWIFKPDTEEEVLAHAQAWHPAEAVVLAFLKGMREMRRQEARPPALQARF
jgi:hypothetical protein